LLGFDFRPRGFISIKRSGDGFKQSASSRVREETDVDGDFTKTSHLRDGVEQTSTRPDDNSM
jgi:hypothetical protein